VTQVPRLLSDDELRREDVPSAWEFERELNRFAHSYDGYAERGGLHALAKVANDAKARWVETGELPESVADLRACLFFEVRRERFVDYTARFEKVGDDPYECVRWLGRPWADQLAYKCVLVETIRDQLRRPDSGR
jgi:hypothetical protein